MKGITKDNITSPDVADELIERATRAFLRFCEREGGTPTQPSRSDSTFDPETMRVTLANVKGTLAVYRYSIEHDRLSFVDTTGGAVMSDRNLSEDVQTLNAISVAARTVRDLCDANIESTRTHLAELAFHGHYMASQILRAADADGLPASAVEGSNRFAEIEAAARGMRFAAELVPCDAPTDLRDFSEQISRLAGWIEDSAIKAADGRGMGAPCPGAALPPCVAPQPERAPSTQGPGRRPPQANSSRDSLSLAISAYDAASLAREHMGQFAALFHAIRREVPEHSGAASLASLGGYLAGDHQNTLDGECEELDQVIERAKAMAEAS